MSRRARHRPDKRRVALNSVQIAIEGAALLAPADRVALQRICDDALSAYSRGVDAQAHWLTLADALNVAEALAQAGICSDSSSVRMIDQAQRALGAAHQRHAERGTWAMRGPELQALGDGVLIHRIQLDHCSVREYVDAVESTKRHMQAARAGNAPAGAVVCVGALS